MNTSIFTEFALPFERSVSTAFQNVWDYMEDDNNTNWTKAINKILWQTIKSVNNTYKVAACKLDTSDCKEWLYDFVCYQNNSVGLDNVFFIAESEWKNPFGNEDYLQDVQYDFEKLLLAKAPYKLMVFEGENDEEVKSSISHLTSVIKNSKLTQPKDRYMFAGWIRSKEFYIDIYIHE